MPRLTRQDLQQELERTEEIVDEVATILADENVSDEEKLAALEELIFDTDEDDEEEKSVDP